MAKAYTVSIVSPGSFETEKHYYTRVLNAQLHPLVKSFLNLDNSRIAKRYCHLHPHVSFDRVMEVLNSRVALMPWAGADLFCVTNDRGARKMVVVETNSCPSGQKSMPTEMDRYEQGGYRQLLQRAFLPQLQRKGLPNGGLAVLFDKNYMEVTGYAACMADLTDQPVYLVPFFADDPDPPARFDKGLLYVRHHGEWHPIRAAFRYVTQRPWTRIPPVTRTLIFNPVLACLAGGRNKLLAAKAYDLFNAQMQDSGLAVRVPETIWDLSLEEVPMWVDRMGGVAVVKNPYSNAGQGVYTIFNQSELDAFMQESHRYSSFIVQALIGNHNWSSRGTRETLYHLGTLPDRKNRIFVCDLRFMIGNGPEGFFPVATYARRAPMPLSVDREDGHSSWSMLGTNLSYKDENGDWQSDHNRLCLADIKDFSRLGLALDDLIEGYMQTVLASLAINEMGKSLLTKKKTFKRRFFGKLNMDKNLLMEITE